MKQRLFVSDIHLEDPESSEFRRFSTFLRNVANEVDEIYLLGDLVEMWVGDDDDSPCAKLLGDLLSELSEHCTVLLMHGNRDFLIGEQFCDTHGARLIPDPYLTDDGILLSHGDAYCTDDAEYQAMRAMFRSEHWQQDILSKSLSERKSLGQMLRAQSKNSNANKATNIMDVNVDAIEQAHRTHKCRVLIHGHTHRPGIHPYSWGQRIVLGAWERCGWACRQQGDTFRLICFS